MNKRLKTALLVFLDVFFVLVAYFVPLIKKDVLSCVTNNWYYLVGGVALTVLLNAIFKLYSNLLTYVGFIDAVKIATSAMLSLFYNLVIAVISDELYVEWALISTMIAYICVFITRFYPRGINYIRSYGKRVNTVGGRIRVMVIGAGRAGFNLIREMKNTERSTLFPVCVLDDDPNKIGKYINGVKVVGRSGEAEYYAEKYGVQEIIIAMPSASKKVISRIISVCQQTQCKIKTVPGLYQLASGQVSVMDIKEVSIDDLLGREQVEVNLNEIMGYIEGKTVLVTGGGGSIGSELCRQIATHNPERLIIVDIYENNAYDIQQELLRNVPNLNLKVLIASVRDEAKVNSLFDKYKPHIVFHAAAHKHVPLMEDSPNEAVKNNVGGTFNVADAAGRNNAEKFILISTDKAVNPTNIMGATKRICEMIIQTMDKKYDTEYVAVRFGNVLGSNGSVIPLFKKQIKNGGPVTVTHKDIVRYFMTIPEAVSLVLQAGAYAKGGEIFVLDMGDPVRIYDLAVNMIKLSGFEPHTDIEIKITGLRPGEKLYEERLMAEEGLEKTENKMISIGKPLEIDEKHLFSKVKRLEMEAIEETEKMKELVHELVPSYKIDFRS